MAATINDANHWLFQLANSFLFMSYLSKDVLVLRVVLMGAGLSFVLWGSLILKVAVDTVVWNAIFTVINAYRAAEVAWSRRPIKFDCPEHETLYDELFGPVGIGRLKFRMLMEQGLLRKIKRGTTYLEAGNEASNLTLIYSGTMDIISSPKDGRPPEKVGAVERMQFVESPQWANMQVQRSKKATPSRHPPSEQSPSIGANTGSAEWKSSRPTNDEAEAEELGLASTVFLGDDEDVRAASTVEVTFRATVDVVYFTWPLERLQYFLRKNPSLRAPVNSIVGADVASKLFRQGTASKGVMSALQRRLYLPMDEPSEIQAILPVEESDVDRDATSGKNEVGLSIDIATADSADSTLLTAGSTTPASDADRRNTCSAAALMRKSGPLEAEKLWLESRGLQDTDNDKKLAALLMKYTTLNKYELSVLLSKGRWRRIRREGTVLIREGESAKSLCMVLHGRFSVRKGGDEPTQPAAAAAATAALPVKVARELHHILPGQLVGSVEFNEPEREHVAGETVISLEPSTYIEWEMDDLRDLLKPRPHLRAQLTALVAADVATKFRQVQDAIVSFP